LKGYNFSNVAIIGGGGTARAALGALDGKCGEMDILLRNPDRAEKLSSCLTSSRINIFDMKHDLAKYDLVIATVPMGVSDMVTIDASSVSGLLLEALYRPWPTKLVERWEIAGGNVISGLDLLVEQALFQIELFSKVKFDFDAMRMELLQVGHRALAL
jgi:shikimate dehydrogenase